MGLKRSDLIIHMYIPVLVKRDISYHVLKDSLFPYKKSFVE